MHSFFLFLALISAAPSSQDPYELFGQIWSPYCKGNSLLECPSSQAQELREEIVLRMKNGEKSEDLLKELNARYDNKLRMTPKGEGRESLAYIVPWILFVLGIFSVLIFWKRKNKREAATMQKAKSILHSAPSEIQNKILRDLDDRDQSA
ncbi:MAG: cytochrome c-type biogenesis protein CcmH [Deltaproteobacteria bacterium]|nr:cytochrome c-type biogenesis protein CcmH [Deltaproteobacteria bacterium]